MNRHRVDGGLSDAAIAFRDGLVPDPTAVDFEHMDRVRADYAEQYRAGAERAIDRHGLRLDDVDVGGIPCVRVRSRAGTQRGTMLYLFGGAFMVGSPYSDLPVIGALADRCRVEVVAPVYRLAPEHPAPSASDDAVAAYRVLAHESARLLLAGESAGGNLAVLTAQRARAERIRQPAAMALLSPAVDLRPDPELYPVPGIDPSLDPQRIIDVGRAYVGERAFDDPSVSPLFAAMEGLPPTIITTGTRDLLSGMCLRLERKMRRAGVAVDCRVWDGLWHVFEYHDDFPESAESLAEIAAFLDAH